MVPAIASRIPLVRRPKAPALPLQERITHLTALTVAPAGASHQDLVARASGVLNYAALIASDVAMPHLAGELCWRQHRAFATAGHLTGSIAVMSLMPVINVSRLLTREGDGEAAYQVLTRLYRAAQNREAVDIHGHTVDLSKLTATDADHRKVCEEVWIAVLVDGARALARVGRWMDAADAMAKYRGIAGRLLDGRQIRIMSLMERGLYQQAQEAIDATVPTEPWEKTVAALLRASCRPATSPAPRPEVEVVLREVAGLLAEPEASTAVFQTRAALAALDLARDRTGVDVTRVLEAVVDVAALDAYAAREVLHHPVACSGMCDEERQRLRTAVVTAGLGAGALPRDYLAAFMAAVDDGDAALRALLSPGRAHGAGA